MTVQNKALTFSGKQCQVQLVLVKVFNSACSFYVYNYTQQTFCWCIWTQKPCPMHMIEIFAKTMERVARVWLAIAADQKESSLWFTAWPFSNLYFELPYVSTEVEGYVLSRFLRFREINLLFSF